MKWPNLQRRDCQPLLRHARRAFLHEALLLAADWIGKEVIPQRVVLTCSAPKDYEEKEDFRSALTEVCEHLSEWTGITFKPKAIADIVVLIDETAPLLEAAAKLKDPPFYVLIADLGGQTLDLGLYKVTTVSESRYHALCTGSINTAGLNLLKHGAPHSFDQLSFFIRYESSAAEAYKNHLTTSEQSKMPYEIFSFFLLCASVLRAMVRLIPSQDKQQANLDGATADKQQPSSSIDQTTHVGREFLQWLVEAESDWGPEQTISIKKLSEKVQRWMGDQSSATSAVKDPTPFIIQNGTTSTPVTSIPCQLFLCGNGWRLFDIDTRVGKGTKMREWKSILKQLVGVENCPQVADKASTAVGLPACVGWEWGKEKLLDHLPHVIKVNSEWPPEVSKNNLATAPDNHATSPINLATAPKEWNTVAWMEGLADAELVTFLERLDFRFENDRKIKWFPPSPRLKNWCEENAGEECNSIFKTWIEDHYARTP